MMEYFDYIVIGSGSSGAVVASRIAEKNKYSVLLLEAGGKNSNPWLHIPIGVGKILTDPKLVWNYNTEPELGLNKKSIYWPRGRVLGGSSSINGMLYVRGAPHKYNEWRDGNKPGWGYTDLLPYFNIIEDVKGDKFINRGRSGPISVTSGNYKDDLSKAFYTACVDVGAKQNEDYNLDFDGVGWLQYSTKNGLRSSTANSYLKFAKNFKKLKISINSEVEKIVFDKNNRAVGIKYRYNNILKEVRVNSEIILSAGPINSPKLLELSGIGNNKILSNLGIKTNYHLPGVGENLTDHLQTRITYETSLKVTVNDILNNRLRGMSEMLRYFFKRNGLFSIASATVHSLMRSDPKNIYPDLKVQMMLISGQDRYARNKKIGLDPFSGFSIGTFPLYPKSRGSTHLRSSNPQDTPIMKANYLSEEYDQQITVKGLELIRKIISQPVISKHVIREVRPGSKLTDYYDLLSYARNNGQTSWHLISTCRMGKSKLDVVDYELKVYGTKNLRVIDSSIMPNMPTSNTNVPSIVIGEKGADLILKSAKNY